MKSMVLFYPEGVDLEKIAINYKSLIPNFQIDKLCYILNVIVRMRRKDEFLQSGFKPVSSKLLKNVIPGYKAYLDALIESDVIDSNQYYQPGKQCKSYRINPRYSHDRLKAWRATCLAFRKLARKKNDDHPLNQWFDQNLRIDEEKAIASLQMQLESREINIDSYNAAYIAIESIVHRDYRFKIDSTAGRYHSVITSLKAALRPYVSHGGNKLVSCDICCSQPYFLLTIVNEVLKYKKRYKNDGSNSNEFKESLLRKITVVKGVRKRLRKMIFSIMWEKFLEHVDYQLFDEYIKDVLSGVFYDKIMAEYNNRYGLKKTRKDIKTVVFKVMYGKFRNGMGQVVFKSLYPSVYELLEVIKQNEHRRVAVLLQSIEAQIVLNVISKRISTERPFLPILTIHDCVVTTAGSEGYVKSIMQKELQAFVGEEPTIKVEPW